MFETMRQLHPRGAANRGICVDGDGAMLGPACVLVERTPSGFRGISRDDASPIQKCVLDDDRDADWLFQQSQRIADALNKGEIALAQIYGLRIPVGYLDDRLLKQLAAKSFTKWSFNPDEPRIPKGDPHGGEWTTGDGSELIALKPPNGISTDFAVGGGEGGASALSGSSADSSGGTSPSEDDAGASLDPNSGMALADLLVPDSDALEFEDGAPSDADTPSADDTDSGTSPPERPPISWEMKPFGDATPDGSQNGGAGDSGQLPPPTAALVGDAPSWLTTDLTPATEDALKLLLGRLSGAVTVFGILLIPTNNSKVVEGQIAGLADLSYLYDGDTGSLQIRQNIGSLGSVVLDEAHIGTDGLFRDAEGNVIGRYVSGSGVAIDVGALSGYQNLSETDQEQAKLCPDPNAENINGRSERSLAYQEQISGLPRGLEVTLNGVRFDGCIEADGTMLEAKGPGFEDKMSGPFEWLGWFTGDERIEAQMIDQQFAVAAAGRTVEWHFAEEPVADFFLKFAQENGLSNIVVFYTRPRQR